MEAHSFSFSYAVQYATLSLLYRPFVVFRALMARSCEKEMVSLQVPENSHRQDKERGDKEQSPRCIQWDKAHREIRSPRDSYTEAGPFEP